MRFHPGVIAASLRAETAALLAAMSVQPTAARKEHINRTIAALIDAGIWGKLDALWVIAAHDEQAARLNWINPGTFDLTIGGGAPIFAVDEGYTTDGVDDWLDTNFNPATAGGSYAQDSTSFGIWNNLEGKRSFGSGWGDGSDGIAINPRNPDDEFVYRVHNSSFNSSPSQSAVGLFVAERVSDSSIRAYRNGARRHDASRTSTPLNNATIKLGNGEAGQFRADQYAIAFAGGRLTVEQHAQLFEILNIHMTALGIGKTPIKTVLDATIGVTDPISNADITGNGLQDLLIAQNDGLHYWYEQTSRGQFARHAIRASIVTGATFESCHWGDLNQDGEYEAYSGDQVQGNIWCHVQDNPGAPAGTWTGGIIASGKHYVQNLLVVDLDGTPGLLYSWEGAAEGDGGIGLLTYNGLGDMTDSVNWTDTVLNVHEGAWHIDPAGLLAFGGDEILAFSGRIQGNTDAIPGVFYITKPEGSPIQAWAKTQVHQSAADWLHVASGDFFGNGVSTDLAVHDINGNIKLFNSSDAWSAIDLSTSENRGKWNLVNLRRQANGRDVLLSMGALIGGLWEWNGSDWGIAIWDVPIRKTDGPVLFLMLMMMVRTIWCLSIAAGMRWYG